MHLGKNEDVNVIGVTLLSLVLLMLLVLVLLTLRWHIYKQPHHTLQLLYNRHPLFDTQRLVGVSNNEIHYVMKDTNKGRTNKVECTINTVTLLCINKNMGREEEKRD